MGTRLVLQLAIKTRCAPVLVPGIRTEPPGPASTGRSSPEGGSRDVKDGGDRTDTFLTPVHSRGFFVARRKNVCEFDIMLLTNPPYSPSAQHVPPLVSSMPMRACCAEGR